MTNDDLGHRDFQPMPQTFYISASEIIRKSS